MTNRMLLANMAIVTVICRRGAPASQRKTEGRADDWERAPLSGNISTAFDTNIWEMYSHFL